MPFSPAPFTPTPLHAARTSRSPTLPLRLMTLRARAEGFRGPEGYHTPCPFIRVSEDRRAMDARPRFLHLIAGCREGGTCREFRPHPRRAISSPADARKTAREGILVHTDGFPAVWPLSEIWRPHLGGHDNFCLPPAASARPRSARL